jgi:hypothetical protein
MALNIVSLALVLGITFIHSIFGLFSGMLNLSCTIIAAVVAFGFFEPLGLWMAEMGLHPAYTPPVALILLFVVTLILLRAAADNLIRGNVHVPHYVDWGGAAVCGFLNAQITVGVIVISVLMLPIGGTVMGFTRYARTSESDLDHSDLTRFERRSLWLRSDEMTVGLVSALSGGSLRGKTAVGAVYPNFVDQVFFGNNTVQWESSPAPYRDNKGDGVEKGIRVEKWWEQTEPVVGRYRKGEPTAEKPLPPYQEQTFRPAEGNKLVAVHVTLLPASADRDGNRRLHVFRPTMLRLVGRDERETSRDYVARIVEGADERIGGKPRICDMDSNFSLDGASDVPIYAYFEVPEDFRPQFVEYRRFARAGLDQPPLEAKGGKRPDVPALALLSDEERRAQAGTARGAMRFIDVIEYPSGDATRLPMPLGGNKARRGEGVELEGKALKSGRILGERGQLAASEGSETNVEDFHLPAGYRLCQIRFKPKRALTIAGQVFNYVARNVNQYFAVDDSGDKVPLCGYFAVVKRGGKDYMELFYTGEPEPMTFRSMLDFKEIKSDELTADDTILGLLFLVKGGRTVTKIENQTGQGVEGLSYKMYAP